MVWQVACLSLTRFRLYIHGIIFSAHTEHELTVSSSDNTRENAPISHFSKVVKNLSRAASPQGPYWCILKDCDFSVCIWYGVFLAATRESQLWENCKGRDRTSSWAFRSLVKSLSFLCFVPPIFILPVEKWRRQKLQAWKELFNFTEKTSQQDWVSEKKKKKGLKQ